MTKYLCLFITYIGIIFLTAIIYIYYRCRIQKNQIKFSEGMASSFELSQAQTQLYSAQQQYIQGMFNLINTYVILDTLVNPIQN